MGRWDLSWARILSVVGVGLEMSGPVDNADWVAAFVVLLVGLAWIVLPPCARLPTCGISRRVSSSPLVRPYVRT